MRAATNERKYQFIKLVNSGRSLREIKALAKSVDTAFLPEYANAKSLNDLARIEGEFMLSREIRQSILWPSNSKEGL